MPAVVDPRNSTFDRTPSVPISCSWSPVGSRASNAAAIAPRSVCQGAHLPRTRMSPIPAASTSRTMVPAPNVEPVPLLRMPASDSRTHGTLIATSISLVRPAVATKLVVAVLKSMAAVNSCRTGRPSRCTSAVRPPRRLTPSNVRKTVRWKVVPKVKAPALPRVVGRSANDGPKPNAFSDTSPVSLSCT